MNTINSSKITWYIMQGSIGEDDWSHSYCADGDGIVQVIEYADGHFELVDQCEVIKAWNDVDGYEEVLLILEEAQKYLAATYHAIYEDAMHWEEEGETQEEEEERQALRAIMR